MAKITIMAARHSACLHALDLHHRRGLPRGGGPGGRLPGGGLTRRGARAPGERLGPCEPARGLPELWLARARRGAADRPLRPDQRARPVSSSPDASRIRTSPGTSSGAGRCWSTTAASHSPCSSTRSRSGALTLPRSRRSTAGNTDEMQQAFQAGRGDYLHAQGPGPQQLEKAGLAHIVASVGGGHRPRSPSPAWRRHPPGWRPTCRRPSCVPTARRGSKSAAFRRPRSQPARPTFREHRPGRAGPHHRILSVPRHLEPGSQDQPRGLRGRTRRLRERRPDQQTSRIRVLRGPTTGRIDGTWPMWRDPSVPRMLAPKPCRGVWTRMDR